MKTLLDVDSTLSPRQPLYRTIDFFAAATIASQKQLAFTRADRFEDKNEGIERLLHHIENAGTPFQSPLENGMAPTDLHNQWARSHFVSCWTRKCESVAMWSLYSQDFCSVRISTTVEKLATATERLLDGYSIERFNESNAGQNLVYAAAGSVAPVIYKSLLDMHKSANRRAKAWLRLKERYKQKGLGDPYLDYSPSVAVENVLQAPPRASWLARLKLLVQTCRIKDSSFQHEDEVRAAVRISEALPDAYGSWLFPALRDRLPNKYHMARTAIGQWRPVQSVELPERISVKVPSDFIQSVAVDPRCPEHKAAFIRRFFADHEIPVVVSSCFGYIPDLTK